VNLADLKINSTIEMCWAKATAYGAFSI